MGSNDKQIIEREREREQELVYMCNLTLSLSLSHRIDIDRGQCKHHFERFLISFFTYPAEDILDSLYIHI
jgi:hypothetical protein